MKEDKQAAATTVYTALQAINYLKVLLSPFLPHSAQALHEMLGFEGRLFGELSIREFKETERVHEGLVYDGTGAIGAWQPETLPPGQALGTPVALFRKLDAEAVVEEELARLGAGGK